MNCIRPGMSLLMRVAPLLHRLFSVGASMSRHLPMMLHWFVAGLFRTKALLVGLSPGIIERFHMAEANRGFLGLEALLGRNIHAFLGHLAGTEIPVPVIDWVSLLAMEQNGVVHTLHFLFSVLDTACSFTRRPFALDVKIPGLEPPLVLELPMEAFAVKHFVSAVPQAGHTSHLGGVNDKT